MKAYACIFDSRLRRLKSRPRLRRRTLAGVLVNEQRTRYSTLTHAQPYVVEFGAWGAKSAHNARMWLAGISKIQRWVTQATFLDLVCSWGTALKP